MNLPQIIMPGEEAIRKAVSRLNTKFPGFFSKVKEIRVAPGGVGYGFVNNKEMGVIFLDLNRIKTTIEGRFIGASDEQKKEALISALAETISHEVGHIQDELQHGEFPAEEKARQTMRQLNTACQIYEELAVKYARFVK